MRKLKMIAAWALSILAVACAHGPVYADEIHPWCGAVYEAALLGATQPEDAEEFAEIIDTAEGITQAQKEMATMALLLGVLIRENLPSTTDVEANEQFINNQLETIYKSCLKEHA